MDLEKLPPLPWADNALEPVISKRTIDHHYGKHHQTYLAKLAGLLEGGHRETSLEEIVMESYGKNQAVFNNAAQVWNHSFYWNSMTPDQVSLTDERLKGLVASAFGSEDSFREKWVAAATGQFGSGWIWLVYSQADDSVDIIGTPNAECPLHLEGRTPLLTMDVWEHAYYLDWQQDRAGHAEAFVDRLINWDFAADNLKKA